MDSPTEVALEALDADMEKTPIEQVSPTTRETTFAAARPERQDLRGSYNAHQHYSISTMFQELDIGMEIFQFPEHLCESAWLEHAPFAFWVIKVLRPRIFVELGAHRGLSYFSFCQAIKEFGIPNKAYAVDTWKGDAQSGFYDEAIFNPVHQHNDANYSGFSSLIRLDFNEAAANFEDGEIDLLHIDGFHSYESVTNDFDVWKSKLSKRGVVLFHDTNARMPGYGVWRAWKEWSKKHASFEFIHGHGLGVLGVGAELPHAFEILFSLSDRAADSAGVRDAFASLGHSVKTRWLLQESERERSYQAQLIRRAEVAAANAQSEFDRLELDSKRQLDSLTKQFESLKLEHASALRDRTIIEENLTLLPDDPKRLQKEVSGQALLLMRRRWLTPLPGSVALLARQSYRLALAVLLPWKLPILLRAVRQDRRALVEAKTIKASSLFDAVWYLSRYPDVRQRGIDPALHYVLFGAAEGRDPGPQFSTNGYKECYSDARDSRMNPLLHYLNVGSSDRRLVPSANLTIYSSDRDEIIRRFRASGLFDDQWYRAEYSEILPPGADPALHYLLWGAAAGLDPGPHFSTREYEFCNPDIANARMNPLDHYLCYGRGEGRWIGRNSKSAQAPQSTRVKIVWIGGEAETPGYVYRVKRWAAAAQATGADVAYMPVEPVRNSEAQVSNANFVVIWRAAWSDSVAAIVNSARSAGARIVFDVDDLMVDPAIATFQQLDGIRSQRLMESDVRAHYTAVRATALQADFCTATTEELAAHLRRLRKPTIVLPNGYDDQTLKESRLAVRKRAKTQRDGLLRIGYSGGTLTHQRDFAQCADACARVLRENSKVRLVLFKDPVTGAGKINIDEFPSLKAVEQQIEWRDFVRLDQLPDELARFDINIVPLEVGNAFAEAKSELKFFEAALVEVATIASPTGPFVRSIRPEHTGFLARSDAEWRAILTRLIGDERLRQEIGRAAFRDALWRYGPDRRVELVTSLIDQLRGGRSAARAFKLESQRNAQIQPATVITPHAVLMFEHDSLKSSDVTVVVPLYNYAHFIEECLESVVAQTLVDIDLIIVDDASTDQSLNVATRWATQHASRFNRLLLCRNSVNSKLGPTRNVGADRAETPFVFFLDADNRLRPNCLSECLQVIKQHRAAFAYPVIQQFGSQQNLMGHLTFEPSRLINGNFIDAMAIVSKGAWLKVGGYKDVQFGWEDYDFWCRLIEDGLLGVAVGGAPLAEYRVHAESMCHTLTNLEKNRLELVADIENRHPWVSVTDRLGFAADN